MIVLGDINAQKGMLDEHMDRNGEMRVEFESKMDLENLNKTMEEGRVTWSMRNQDSSID